MTLTSALKACTGGTDLPAGTPWSARQHTVNTYAEGRPTDGTATVANQVTTTKVGAYADGYPSDADVRTTKTEYDWVKGLPTATTTDPSGLALKTTTSYDSQGRVAKTTLPKSSCTNAGATVTTYYSAAGTGACNGKPEWADLVCSTGPAAAIIGGGSNPTQLPTKTRVPGRALQPRFRGRADTSPAACSQPRQPADTPPPPPGWPVDRDPERPAFSQPGVSSARRATVIRLRTR